MHIHVCFAQRHQKSQTPNISQHRSSVDLSYPVRLCYLPLKQWVVRFDNEKCYLLNSVLLMCATTTTLNLPLQ